MFSNTKLPEQLDKQKLEENFKKMKEGDIKARNEIIEHNIKLVLHIAQKFNDPNYETEDLESIGMIGLIKSVNTFDLSKNIHFATYASRCIENEILMYLRNNSKRKNDVSLNYTLAQNHDGEQLELKDILEDPYQDFVSQYEDLEIQAKLRKIVEELSETERFIIMKYYRFIDDNKITQKEIAKELGINRNYLNKRIKKILKKIELELKKIGIVKGAIRGATADIPKKQKNSNPPKVKVLSKKEM